MVQVPEKSTFVCARASGGTITATIRTMASARTLPPVITTPATRAPQPPSASAPQHPSTPAPSTQHPAPQHLSCVSLLRDLREHAQRDFRRRSSTQIESDRRADAGDALVGNAVLAEHLRDQHGLAAAAEQA